MACIYPVKAWPDLRAGGRYRFTRDARLELGPEIELDCGQCAHCRLRWSSEVALRCMHELRTAGSGCFVTLTIGDEHFPSSDAAWHRMGVLFLKRLRKRFPGVEVRTFGCRELGTSTRRPHFHFLVFGVDLDRGEPVGKGDGGSVVYRSEVLEALWPFGLSSVGDLTEQSAGYVARYALKHFKGRFREAGLVDVVSPSGELVRLAEAESVGRSRGLGRAWVDLYGAQAVAQGAVIGAGGVRSPVPLFYSRRVRLRDPLAGSEARAAGELRAVATAGERTPQRRLARYVVEQARVRNRSRGGV